MNALAICVALVVILATIALPTVLRPRQPANEAAAVANLRRVNTAQAAYFASKRTYGQVIDLADFGLLGSRFLGTISEYKFAVRIEASDYVATATPVSPNAGRYEYYSMSDGIVRYSRDSSRAPANQAAIPVH